MLDSERNRAVYNSDKVVRDYAENAVGLQKAEATIFAELDGELPRMDVLDIGVGTGRTSAHLVPRVRSYVGLDYADSMIRECLKRFQSASNARFAVADARKLSDLADGSFDLAVFSFNGMDCVDETGRTQVLSEVRRVLRPGGRYCFSSHNLNYDLYKRHSIRLTANPRLALRHLRSWARFRMLNPGYAAKRRGDGGLIIDGTENFQVPIYYIRASRQLEQLAQAGFGRVRVFSVLSGRELSIVEADQAQDGWLYYLATRT